MSRTRHLQDTLSRYYQQSITYVKKWGKQQRSKAKQAITDLSETFCTKDGLKRSFFMLMSNSKSGLIVGLTAVPSAVSLAIATNASPSIFIISAIYACFIASLLGGSSFNLIGPTGSVTGIVAKYGVEYGIEMIPLCSVIAGAMSLLVPILQLERYFLLIPSSVIHGFTLGIAVKMGLGQIPNALGIKISTNMGLTSKLVYTFQHVLETNLWAIGLFVISFVIFYLLIRKFPKIPWLILMAGFGIFIGFITETWLQSLKLLVVAEYFPHMNFVFAEIPTTDSLRKFIQVVDMDFLYACASVAFVSIFEALLSAKIAYGMTEIEFSERREVLGLSLANLISGVLGGAPASAAFQRTQLNIKNGATSRLSGLFSAIVVLLVSLGLLRFFSYFSVTICSSMLAIQIVRMVETHKLKQLFRMDKRMFGLSMLVAIMVVVFNSAAGIAFGMIASLLFFTDNYAIGHSEIVYQTAKKRKGLGVYHFSSMELDKIAEETQEDPLLKVTEQPTTPMLTPQAESIQFDNIPQIVISDTIDDALDKEEEEEHTHRQTLEVPKEAVHPQSGMKKVSSTSDFFDVPFVESTYGEGDEAHIEELTHQGFRVPSMEFQQEDTVVYRITGQLTYLNSMSHVLRIKKLKTPKTIILSFHYLYYMDLDGLDAIEKMIQVIEKNKIKVKITGLNESCLAIAKQSAWYKKYCEKPNPRN